MFVKWIQFSLLLLFLIWVFSCGHLFPGSLFYCMISLSSSSQYHVVVQSPGRVRLFVTPWIAALQSSLSLTISRSLPKLMFIALLMYPAISFSGIFFSFCPGSFPASGTFPMSRLFASDDQNTSTSASVLPVSIWGWSPLRLTGLISLLFKGLLGVFSSSTVWRHQFFGILPSLRSSFHNQYHIGMFSFNFSLWKIWYLWERKQFT